MRLTSSKIVPHIISVYNVISFYIIHTPLSTFFAKSNSAKQRLWAITRRLTRVAVSWRPVMTDGLTGSSYGHRVVSRRPWSRWADADGIDRYLHCIQQSDATTMWHRGRPASIPAISVSSSVYEWLHVHRSSSIVFRIANTASHASKASFKIQLSSIPSEP